MVAYQLHRPHDPGGRIFAPECDTSVQGDVPGGDPAGRHFGRSGAVLAQAVAFWYRKQTHCAQERHLANVVQGAGQLRTGCRGGRAL